MHAMQAKRPRHPSVASFAAAAAVGVCIAHVTVVHICIYYTNACLCLYVRYTAILAAQQQPMPAQAGLRTYSAAASAAQPMMQHY
jgi:hypothetical protein